MSVIGDRYRKRQHAAELREPAEEANRLAKKLGLEPYPVKYWLVDYDEMNELIAYDGFQHRYPHWRWGMKYDRQHKQDRYGGGKAFEIVNNDDPAHAFLQESNSTADQKAVITHVEAHSDFFANNQWFDMFADDPNAAAMLERHARAIREYMQDPDIDRSEVEKWIDAILTLEDTIDQHRTYRGDTWDCGPRRTSESDDIEEALAALNISDEVRDEIFDDEWRAERSEREDRDEPSLVPENPEKDVLQFLRCHGKQYDDETERAVDMTDWQKDILEMMRAEAYYFAAQKMTKVMNEGWAAYWESMMMGEEAFAGGDEFLQYADHQARVLGSPGLNPYKLGKELWEYVENATNRREVIERLLRVDGITWRNFHDEVDFALIHEALAPPEALDSITADSLDAMAELDDTFIDHDALERARQGEIDVDRHPWKVLTYHGLARRHYSLTKPQNRGFIRRINRDELERIGRYLFDDTRYASVEEALADVEYTAGWDRMRDVRESHNDVTFLDEFLTPEFIDENGYFAYEYSHTTGDYRVSSTDHGDVKKKLLFQFTNFGKPTITVHDGNYDNRNELLLGHHYNGVMLDVEQAMGTLERVFDLWGRPVNLMTIVKELDENEAEAARRRDREPEFEENGKLIRYDGENFEVEDLDWEDVEPIAATDIDYDTKPEEWLA